MKLSDYVLRPNDDDLDDMALWSTGLVCIPVCTYHTFCSLRKKFLPLIKIRPPSEDICLQCHVFRNQFKFNTKQSKAKLYDADSDNDGIEDDKTVQLSNQVVTDEADVAENIILKAATHVRQTRSQ